jgi:hypothetical protein
MAQTEGLTLRICGLEPMDGSILCCGLGFGFGEHRATNSESVCGCVGVPTRWIGTGKRFLF